MLTFDDAAITPVQTNWSETSKVLVARRRNGCAVSTALAAAGCVLVLDAPHRVRRRPASLSGTPNGSPTPRHHFNDRPLGRHSLS
jgi:hypothetical protein